MLISDICECAALFCAKVDLLDSRKPKLLIVEDEEAIRIGLVDVFVFHGFEVEAVDDGKLGLAKALSGRFDLLLLDVMLPAVNGFEILEQVRAQDRDQPVILLTARGADEDIVNGLTLGADDYVSKPFSVAQLVLRVQAVLRRSRVGIERANTIRFDDGLMIDVRNLKATLGGDDVVFTRREMEVLCYLHENNDRPVAREELLTRVWGYARDADIETRTVDIHIAKLRRKIESDPSAPERLQTIRGAGYRLFSN